MDSSSESGRDSGQRSGNRNSGNRNRSRNRNRQGNRSGGDDRNSGGGDRSSSRPPAAPAAPEKKGLFQKIVGFFKGDSDPAGNKGTGRPIQTERKRPGADRAVESALDSSPNYEGERPKRKRARRTGSGEGDGGGGGRRDAQRSSRDGGERRGSRDRDGDGGGRRERRGGGNGERRSDGEDRREEDDRRPRTKREPRIVEVTSGRLYVGNLIYEVTEEELQDLFKGFGHVVSAEVVTNQRNQQSKGFAFVEMSTVDEAKRAVEILHDKDFMGRKLVVTGAQSDGPADRSARDDDDDDSNSDAAATPPVEAAAPVATDSVDAEPATETPAAEEIASPDEEPKDTAVA